jgi:hypothetical protein
MSDYEKRFPLGVQTVVSAGEPDYSKKQVNTRTVNGWWIDTVKPSDVAATLRNQAERFKEIFNQDVDRRYVK